VGPAMASVAMIQPRSEITTSERRL